MTQMGPDGWDLVLCRALAYAWVWAAASRSRAVGGPAPPSQTSLSTGHCREHTTCPLLPRRRGPRAEAAWAQLRADGSRHSSPPQRVTPRPRGCARHGQLLSSQEQMALGAEVFNLAAFAAPRDC